MIKTKQNKEVSFWRTKRAIQLFCILIACVFWVLTKLSKEFEYSKSYQLTYKLPEKKAFASVPPDSAKVYFRGEGWDILYLNLQNDRNELVLALDERAEQTVNKDNVQNIIAEDFVRHNLSLSGIAIDNKVISLENELIKKVPVKLSKALKNIPSYYLQSLTINPDSIELKGPESIISQYEFVELEDFELAQNETRFETELKIKGNDNRLMSFSAETVNITGIFEQLTDKEFEIPIKIVETDKEIQLFPDKVKIQCRVGLSDFDQITASDFEVIADFSDLNFETQANEIIVKVNRISPAVKSFQHSPKLVNFIIVEKGLDLTQ